MSAHEDTDYFSAAQVGELLSEAPRDCPISQQEIGEQLQHLTGGFLFKLYMEGKSPAPSKLARRFRGVEGRAKELLRHLDGATQPLPGRLEAARQLAIDLKSAAADFGLHYMPEQVRAFLDEDNPTDVEQREGVAAARNFANLLARRCELRVEINKRDRRTGHKGNAALDQLFGDLFGLWMDIHQRLPGVSRELVDGEMIPSGPLLRFTETYFRLLRSSLGSDLDNQPATLRDALSPSKDAIIERYRKLGFSGFARKLGL